MDSLRSFYHSFFLLILFLVQSWFSFNNFIHHVTHVSHSFSPFPTHSLSYDEFPISKFNISFSVSLTLTGSGNKYHSLYRSLEPNWITILESLKIDPEFFPFFFFSLYLHHLFFSSLSYFLLPTFASLLHILQSWLTNVNLLMKRSNNKKTEKTWFVYHFRLNFFFYFSPCSFNTFIW